MTGGRRTAVPTRDDWLDLLDRLGAAAAGGLVAGFLVGGIGGRLAMFVLRLTSDDAVRGIESDDGFEIGRVSFDSVFLIAITTLVGAVLAFGYLAVRHWLPDTHRPWLGAVFFGLIGGALVVKPDGVDFTLLDPLVLAVALFVALPAAYGWLMVTLVESLIARPGRARPARVAALIVFAVVGFFGLAAAVIAAAGVLAMVAQRRWPGLAGAVSHPVPTWLVRTALVAIAVASAVALYRDTVEIL